MSAALVLFAACEPAPTPEVSFMLTNDNVEVAGLTADALVVVDAVNYTAAIEVAYADKDQLQALQVNFVGIPEDVTVENFTFDFSTGATKEVTVSQNGATDTYVFSATAAKPEPKFVTLSLKTVKEVKGTNEETGEETTEIVYGEPVAVAGGTAKFNGFANLTSLAVEFTVSPANAKVFTTVDGTEVEVASNDVFDFSDKVNGVTFTIKCEDVTVDQNVKVVTTGYSSLEKVWGHYWAANDWYGVEEHIAGFTAGDGGWDRSAAFDDKYTYMAIVKGGSGAVVLDNKDGSYVATLKNTGIANGTFLTSCVRTIKNGDDSVVLLSNLAMNAGGILKVYAYHSIDAEPEVVVTYTLDGGRYGDFFSVFGDWNNGAIVFTTANKAGDVLVFPITNGVVAETPTKIPVAVTGSYGALYQYSANEYALSLAGQPVTVYNSDYEKVYEYASALSPLHGLSFFEYNEQKYMAGIQMLGGYTGACVRIAELNGETLAASLAANDISNDKQAFGLVDPDDVLAFDTARKNSTTNASLQVREIAGELYIMAHSQNMGIAIYKVK